MLITPKTTMAQRPTNQELKTQLNRFHRRLQEVKTHNFEQLCWFAEIVDHSNRFTPDWVVCQYGDLELLVERQLTSYRVKKIQGYRNPESRYDQEGYLKDNYQEFIPLPLSTETVLLAALN